MSARLLPYLAICGIVLLAIAGAWNHDLWEYDEPREAELARAMYRSGNYACMELGGRPFLDKPPLYCASVALAFRALGRPSVPLARIVSALWALSTLAITAWLARRALGAPAGLLAALVLATTYRFYSISHEVVLDNALGTFTTAAIAFGAVAARERRRAVAVLAALAFSGAFLVKGLVGCGIVGLVLLLDLALRRDKRGLATLLHPLAWLAFLAPIGLYLAALAHAAGPETRQFLRVILWENQVGRFSGSHGQKASEWHTYLSTWPETVVIWVPLAILAMGHAALAVVRPASAATRPGAPSPERTAWLGFFLVWGVAPLAVLSLASGRARSYALPWLPAYALLVAAFWQDAIAGRPVPARLARAIGGAFLLVAAALVAAVLAIGVLATDRLDFPEVAAAVLALAAAATWIARRREKDFASGTEAALLIALLAVSGFLLYSGRFVAARLDRTRSWHDVEREVDRYARGRTTNLFHVSNSYSGTFGFYADRTAPEFDEGFDPTGEKLMASLGPADSAVVLAPAFALGCIDSSRRCDLAVVWSGTRDDDRDRPYKRWALLERRRPGEPRGDPLAALGIAPLAR